MSSGRWVSEEVTGHPALQVGSRVEASGAEPTYGASKAGVHAYTESLREELAGTGVEVTELVPPAVATAGQEKLNPAALPLNEFLDEAIELLTQNPTPREIVVDRAVPLRWVERDGTYAELLQRRAQSLKTLPGR
jgi:uncharacterized oxidoreductase